MGNGKIWPSADAKPLYRSTPNLKHVITSGISSSEKIWAQSAHGIFPPYTRNIYPKPSNVYFTFFSSSEPPQRRPFYRFSRLIRHTTWFCARKCLLGWEKLLISKFDRFIRKIRKIYNGAYIWGNFDKILNCHNSGCMQDRVVIFDSRVGFSGTAYLTASFKIYPRITPVAMATKFGEKSAITRLV